MTEIDGLDCPILGFELLGDSLLRHGDFIPLRQGLTVLYGLNGAGKTRTLRGIRAALTGVADEVAMGMVVRVPSTPSTDDWPPFESRTRRRPPVTVALARAIGRSGNGIEVQDDSSQLFGTFNTLREQEAIDAITQYIQVLTVGDEPLATELAASRLFLFVPTGTPDYPAWDAWAVADLSLPAAARARDELRRVEAELYHDVELAETDEEHASALDRFTDALSHHLLFADDQAFWVRRRRGMIRPRHFSPYAFGVAYGEDCQGLEVVGNVDFGIDVVDVHTDAAEATNAYLASIVGALCEGGRRISPGVGLGLLAGGEEEPRLEGIVRAHGWTTSDSPTYRSRLDDLDELPSDPSDLELMQRIESTVHDVAAALTDRTNEFLRQHLIDPPTLSLRVTPPALRFVSPAAEWRFDRGSLDALSAAERAWARHAINDAIYWHRRGLVSPPALRPVITLIDEPEAALHRSAEAHMAHALTAAVSDPRKALIVATHSPELLDSQRAQLIEVQRDSPTPGSSSIQTLSAVNRESLDRLGLLPSDLLRQYRVILLVEGLHDEVLLDAFIGDRLRAARTRVIPLHGGKHLAHAIDSQLLFEFTRAHLVAVVDNVLAAEVDEAWGHARVVADEEGTDAAIKVLNDRLKKSSDERIWIANWLSEAMKRGTSQRMSAHPLSLKDIVEYLPVERLVPGSTSWDDLYSEHRRLRAERPGTPRNFKQWLEKERRADFSPSRLRAAASDVALHQDFVRLINTIEALSVDDRSDPS